MTMHDKEHDRILLAVTTGELPDDAPEVRRLAACAECRTRLRDLRQAAADLDDAAREQAAMLAAAAVDEPAPGEDRVLERVRAELTRARRPRLRRHWPWLALAAAVIAAVLLFRGGGGGPAVPQLPGDRMLHGQGDARPTGRVPDLEQGFGWPGALQPGEKFELRIYDRGPAGDPTEPAVTRTLSENEWSLDAAGRAALRGVTELEWQVAVVRPDAAGGRSMVRRLHAHRATVAR